MDIFDDTIVEIKEWFQRKGNGGKVRYYDATPLRERSGSTDASSKSRRPNAAIILKEDTHLELGHPSVGSCSAALSTCDSSLVAKNRITLLGPEIPEMDNIIVPFAQIAISSCENDVANTSSTMDRMLHIFAQSDEYMIRSVPNLIWARVSKAGARSGFSLHRLGSRLINALYNECKGITGSEILFVTSSREDVSDLDKIVETVRNKLRQFKTYERTPDGTYECTTALDCDDCTEQP